MYDLVVPSHYLIYLLDLRTQLIIYSFVELIIMPAICSVRPGSGFNAVWHNRPPGNPAHLCCCFCCAASADVMPPVCQPACNVPLPAHRSRSPPAPAPCPCSLPSSVRPSSHLPLTAHTMRRTNIAEQPAHIQSDVCTGYIFL